MALFKELKKTAPYIHGGSPHAEDEPILRVSGISLRYDSGRALDNISFELRDRERLALVGPNGAGKSTLLKIIAGVLEPGAGKVSIRGYEPGGHICIAYVPQRSQIDWSFPATVADTVMMGRIGRIGLFRFPRARDWEVVHQALELVGLQDLARRQIGQLSGGQQQRMFIARALAQEAELVLMDEPLTGLDATSQQDIFTVLDSLRDRGVTLITAMHDLEIAAERFDRVMLLNRRMIGIGRPEEVFTPERLIEAYGGRVRMLPGAAPSLTIDDTCCEECHIHD
ncbi:MAG TPA: metal ABC transporter ATP-binding protein [Chloroflexi bacterium]|nr:metal ABC transporter ATP-binding protein [Chloroflexota bacterium]